MPISLGQRETQEEAKQEMEDSGKKTKEAFTDAAMKGSAKEAKRKEAQREKELQSRSLYTTKISRASVFRKRACIYAWM